MAGLPLPDLIDDGEAIRSRQFDDIYFQPADGAAESRHVFVNGNKLAERFAALPPHTTFTIAELGFGSGLNFLVAMQAFAAHAPPCAQLHYWSAEGFPLPAPTMNVMLAPRAALPRTDDLRGGAGRSISDAATRLGTMPRWPTRDADPCVWRCRCDARPVNIVRRRLIS